MRHRQKCQMRHRQKRGQKCGNVERIVEVRTENNEAPAEVPTEDTAECRRAESGGGGGREGEREIAAVRKIDWRARGDGKEQDEAPEPPQGRGPRRLARFRQLACLAVRWRDCHVDDTPCIIPVETPAKGTGGAIKWQSRRRLCLPAVRLEPSLQQRPTMISMLLHWNAHARCWDSMLEL